MHGDMAMKATTSPHWAFNNVVGMGDKPLFEAAGGESIGIEMTNKTEHFHAIHIHGHDFRIIPQTNSPSRNSTWFDTVVVAPKEIMRIAFVAGKLGKWMIHCHVLEHSVSGMDTWFRVSWAPLVVAKYYEYSEVQSFFRPIATGVVFEGPPGL